MTMNIFKQDNIHAMPAMQEERPVDWGSLFWNFFQFWPFIVLSVIIGGVGSCTYLKYKSPVYSATTKVLIKDEGNSGQLTEAAAFEDIGLISRSGNIENEMEILQSVYLMQDVVKKLDLQHVYLKKGRIRDVDVYKDCPFQVIAWLPADTLSGNPLTFEMKALDDSRYEIRIGKKTYAGIFGKGMRIPEAGTLFMGWRAGTDRKKGEDPYVIVSRSLDAAATSMAGRLTIKSVGKRSTVLELTLQDELVQRAKDVLTEMVRVYNQSQLKDKNRVLENTLVFIEERLRLLTGELAGVETDVERFKSANNVVDLGSEGTLLMEETSAYDKSVSEAEIQLDMLEGVRTHLRKEKGNIDFIPANLGINNPNLNGMMENFNRVLMEREKAGSMLGPNNPQVTALDQQLTNLRTGIVRNIDLLENDLKVARNKNLDRERRLQQRIRSIPRQERQLVEIQRQQTIKQNLYLYLLQKREESELSLRVAVGNNRVVEPPRAGGQVAPVRRNVWALGLGAGLFFPLVVISILQALNTRVRHVDDIRKHSRVPLLGLVNLAPKAYPVAVTGKSRTAVSEMFRLIRANLQFVGNGEHNKVIMVTSSRSGEGKTFISLNLAATLALAGRKVLLMELDMRNPRMYKLFDVHPDKQKGITQYLVNPDIAWQDVVQPTPFNPDLSILTCGPIPPNPSELIMGRRMEELLMEARKSYEYVIVDTAPVGLVSDALLLSRFVDTTLFVVRRNVTLLSHLDIIEENARQGKLPRPYIILNAVGNGFMTYGKGYVYGYGYYQDEAKLEKWVVGLWKKMGFGNGN
jgi:capsular exopolysaccharide synthesis family protein